MADARGVLCGLPDVESPQFHRTAVASQRLITCDNVNMGNGSRVPDSTKIFRTQLELSRDNSI